MWMLIVNAFVFAVLLIVVVVPSLYIKDAAALIDTSVVPPTPGERVEGSGTPQSVRQMLYLLFVIPLCALLNGVFVYMTYYRPLRFVQYRVELNEQSLRLHRMFAHKKLTQYMQQQQQQQAAAGGAATAGGEQGSGGSVLYPLTRTLTTPLRRASVGVGAAPYSGGYAYNNNRSFASFAHTASMPPPPPLAPLSSSGVMSFAFANTAAGGGNNNSNYNASTLASAYTTSALTRDTNYYDAQIRSLVVDSTSLSCARPKMVKRDEYVLTFTYPEVRALCTQVERSFFVACTIAEKNFCLAVRKTFGSSALQELEWLSSSIFGSNSGSGSSSSAVTAGVHSHADMTSSMYGVDEQSYRNRYEHKHSLTTTSPAAATSTMSAAAMCGGVGNTLDTTASAAMYTAPSNAGSHGGGSGNNNTTSSKVRGFRFIQQQQPPQPQPPLQSPLLLSAAQLQQAAGGAAVAHADGSNKNMSSYYYNNDVAGAASSRQRALALANTSLTHSNVTATSAVDGLQRRNSHTVSPPLRVVVHEPIDN